MTDYIKRDDAIDVACGDCPYNCSEVRKKKHPCMEYKELMEIPSADVAPIRRGHWIYDCCDIVCSECGTAFSDEVCYMMRGDSSYHEPKHCLWCGAIMEGGIEE